MKNERYYERLVEFKQVDTADAVCNFLKEGWEYLGAGDFFSSETSGKTILYKAHPVFFLGKFTPKPAFEPSSQSRPQWQNRSQSFSGPRKMNCKFCSEPIEIKTEGGKRSFLNLDGSKHQCKAFQ